MDTHVIQEQLKAAYSESISGGLIDRAQAIAAGLAAIEANTQMPIGMVTNERRDGPVAETRSYKVALVAPGMPDGAPVYAGVVPKDQALLALAELVKLKILKQSLTEAGGMSYELAAGARAEYERRKPIAWSNAMAILRQYAPYQALPTKDMIQAGMEASLLGRPSVDDEAYVRSIWTAMHLAQWQAVVGSAHGA